MPPVDNADFQWVYPHVAHLVVFNPPVGYILQWVDPIALSIHFNIGSVYQGLAW